MARAVLTGLLSTACGGGGSSPAPTPTPTPVPKPNIVFIVNDDLDTQSMPFMPKVQSLLTNQGLTFTKHFSVTSVCAPSRASFLTGQYAHNHGTISNNAPDGGFTRFLADGRESSTIATWLKGAGYHTMFVGKYLNEYPAGNDTYVPPGWDDWHSDFVAPGQPFSGDYYGYFLNDNKVVTSHGSDEQDYLTDVLAKRAVDAIRAVSSSPQPFLLYLAPPAPHPPALRPPRYVASFPGLSAPRTPNWNEDDVSDKPEWLREMDPFTDRDVKRIDELYVDRLATMLAVDDMVEQVVQELSAEGKLANTYIFFTSDNGFLLGPHRFRRGKEAPYEESIRVPLVVRGPGVPGGQVDAMTGSIDFAPTFAALAGIPVPDSVDGRSLVPLLKGGPSPSDWRRDILLEHWNRRDPNDDDPGEAGIPGFFGVRSLDTTYVEYERTDEREYYDLRTDLYELDNGYETAPAAILQPLSARTAALKACRGATCRN
jgi:N-acetylglucosamine-6-sulfatase